MSPACSHRCSGVGCATPAAAPPCSCCRLAWAGNPKAGPVAHRRIGFHSEPAPRECSASVSKADVLLSMPPEVIRMLPASGTSGRDAHPITWAVVHHFWIACVAPRLRTFGEAAVVHDSAWHLGSRLPKPPSRRVCKQVCNEASFIQM